MMKKLGLYIHIPFCKRKCAYCDFVSYPDMEHTFGRYAHAVGAEAALYGSWLNTREVDTVFIGGGTPPLLSSAQISTMIGAVKRHCNWNVREFTIEANPETLDEEKIAAFADTGINRISLGLQTHEDDILQRICRRHTFQTFLDAYQTAREYIPNINVDLIFGLPGQSVQSFGETVRRVIDLGPKHVSAYSLKLEEGTPLHAQFEGVSDGTDRDMYHTAVDLLMDAGYAHYETSNFAQPGYECAHNMKYWTQQEYLGLGVASHSYIDGETKTRHSNTEYVEQYLRSVGKKTKPVAHSETLTAQDQQTEYIMLRLRLKGGLSFADYESRFDQSFLNTFGSAAAEAKNAGLISVSDAHIRPTLKGFDLQNALISLFLNTK